MNRARRPLTRQLDPMVAGLGARVLVALAACAVVIWVWPRATGFTTDSESYLDVARTVLEGGGLRQRVVDFWRPALPDPLGLWPPAYPVAVAAFATLWPLETAARLVSALATVGFALAFHALAARTLRGPAAVLATLLALATPGVAYASGMAWSEPLFLFTATSALAGLVAIAPAHPRRRDAGALVRAAVACGLVAGVAALTRYVGVLLVPVGIVWLVARRAPSGVVVAWTLAAALPPLLWIARCLAVFGRPFGPGLPAAHEPLELVLQDALGGLRWSLLPWPVQDHLVLALPALLVLAALAAAALPRAGVPALVSGYTVLYFIALVGLRSRWTFNVIGERYLTPMLPMVWLACATTLVAAGERVRYVGRAAAVLAVVGIGLGIATLDARMRSPELQAERAARATALAELRRLVPPGDTPVLSDVGHLVRSATGRSAVQVPPLTFSPRPFDYVDLERWRRAGVTEGVFRRPGADTLEERLALEERLGGHLAVALDGSAQGGWRVLAAGERFVRVRLGE
jgi:4-amino-4-deoxy-L-arabinose transferase-like glycosyltransferase